MCVLHLQNILSRSSIPSTQIIKGKYKNLAVLSTYEIRITRENWFVLATTGITCIETDTDFFGQD